MNPRVSKELIDIRKNLRQKYLQLKRGKIDKVREREKEFSPLTEPLKQLVNNSIINRSTFLNTSDISRPKVSHLTSPQKQSPTKSKKAKIVISTPLVDHTPFKSFEDSSLKELNISEEEEKQDQNDDHDDDSSGEQGDVYREDDDDHVDESTIMYESAEDQDEEFKTDSGYTTLFQTKAGKIAGKYLKLLFGSDKSKIEKTFGFSMNKNGKLTIGDQLVKIENDKIILGNEEFIGTPGLFSLLILKEPDFLKLNDVDLKNYKRILEKTGVHLKSDGYQLKANPGKKYQKIIKPLFVKTGKGLVYWDDPNELVERLKLLVASQTAGNNSHQNEIIDIVEELKEANIIY